MLSTFIAVGAVVVALLALAWALRSASNKGEPQIQGVRNDLNQLRESSERSLQAITSAFSTQMQSMQSGLQNALTTVTADVGNRLDSINRQVAERLNDNATALRSGSKEVNDRIADVQSTFAGLQKQVGEMTEQARQLGELSRTIGELQNVLSAPKLRGGFGETQLENLLAMVFARDQFATQYRFASGDQPDAVLFLPQGLVAIDSKFPLENFRRIASCPTDAEKKAARREFLRDVKKRIDEIANKYIRPGEGTLPFALMYVPAENVYYEAIIRDEDGNDLHDYCVLKKVTPVSPNSLYAYLQTIAVGLKSMQINERTVTVLREIQSLQVELEKFSDLYSKLGIHLKNATRSYDDSTREFNKVEGRVENLAGAKPEQLSLPAEPKQRAIASGEV